MPDDTIDPELKAIHSLVSGNILDIYHIRMELERLRGEEEEEELEEVNLEPLRTYINEGAPPIPQDVDTLDYFLKKCGVDPEDVENINSIKQENRELRKETNDLRRRLIEILEEEYPDRIDDPRYDWKE